MTTVNISLRKPNPAGTLDAAVGKLLWQPTARHLAGSDVVLPLAFEVPLVAGAASLSVAPTTPTWVWRVTEVIDGQPKFTRFVVVPDSVAAVSYIDLVDVNPASLDPSALPDPMWIAMADSTVTTGTVNGAGHLLLTRSDGVVVDAGYVVGAQGDTGPANQITVGTVTEGPTASVTLVGAAPNQTLNIVLPVMSQEAHALSVAYATVL
jgi:hypothetical protein